MKTKSNKSRPNWLRLGEIRNEILIIVVKNTEMIFLKHKLMDFAIHFVVSRRNDIWRAQVQTLTKLQLFFVHRFPCICINLTVFTLWNLFFEQILRHGIKKWHLYLKGINLSLNSDLHLISPFIITPESHIKVTKITEMVANHRSSWLVNKFSMSVPQEVYK